MHDGGYESGYAACPCFWGESPGSLVRRFLDRGHDIGRLTVLDAGCGEGKNAFALAERGCVVDAIDCSARAVAVGMERFAHPAITWSVADIADWPLETKQYDMVVAYGLLHCLPSAETISMLVGRLQAATAPGGTHIICAFNNGPHDFSAHPGFTPTLLPHESYLGLYRGWQIVAEDSSILHETHPHNGVPHHHSMTRLIAEKP